ncbi:phage terminase large subunit [Amycolatopsis thailandensis]|uniref:phage terminase large subunit n=1 Tax=Amycolatopsis thailandensis TaxID=589330 RepID=UPI003791CF6E
MITAPVVLQHFYEPWGTARELLHCRDTEVLMSGPAGTGKSRACLQKLHLMCLANPGMRGLILRKTLVSLTSTGLVTFKEHVASEALATGILKFFGGSAKEPAAYKYGNGSTLVVGGMDNPTKIMSSEYDVIYVQEAIEISEDDWEKLLTRLRNGKLSFHQLMADTNPDAETHWLNIRCQNGKTTMLRCTHEDNPVLFNRDGSKTSAGEAYIGILDGLTGVRKQRLRHGLWVAAEGIVYEEYNPKVHLVDKFAPPESWTRWWCVDFGYTNPFVLQCWAEDPDGRLYLYREIYHSKRLVEDHARDILLQVTKVTGRVPDRKVLTAKDIRDDVRAGLREWTEPKPRGIICDHDAEDRETLSKHVGISNTAADKRKKIGIQAVQSRMKVIEDGRPRIFFMENTVVERDPELERKKLPCSTVEELATYVWEDKATKEEPVKENDHGMDTMRYMVAERDMGGRPRVRTLGGRRR